MTSLQSQLFALRDDTYAQFQRRIIPNITPESIIGVRVPALRKIEKAFRKTDECQIFLQTLPHNYYEENLLHSILLSNMKDYNETLNHVETFLPYIDNWAVCDTLRPETFKKNKNDVLIHIKKWIASDHAYTCRFGIDSLMTYYLDDDFKPEYLELPAQVHSEEYYVNMMIAWYYATALAKQWNATIPYIENNRLDPWVHNKTIQKARESYRITDEQKIYLKSLKK